MQIKRFWSKIGLFIAGILVSINLVAYTVNSDGSWTITKKEVEALDFTLLTQREVIVEQGRYIDELQALLYKEKHNKVCI